MINQEQKEECIRLYREGILTIKGIMSKTGIRSEQTIYRILNAAGVPRRPVRPTEWRTTISFDSQTYNIIEKLKPKNVSEWICNLIKEKFSQYETK